MLVRAGIAIRFGPKILLKCDRRKTGPKYPCTGLDDGYKSSFSLNHYVRTTSLRPAHDVIFILLAFAPRLCFPLMSNNMVPS